MLCVACTYGPLAYLAGERALSVQADGAGGLGALAVASVFSGLALILLAVPVRRGRSVPWRAAQATAVVAMGTALFGLHMAAREANTPMAAVAAAVAVAAVAVNIALWSTEVRRWCAP